MNFILIRHAENEKKGTFALTSVGQEFAKNLPITQKLANVLPNIERIYSNEALRCVQTVQPLSDACGNLGHQVPVIPRKDDMSAESLKQAIKDVAQAPNAENKADQKWAVICCRSIDLDANVRDALTSTGAVDKARFESGGDLDKLFNTQCEGYDMFMAFSGQGADGQYQRVKAFHQTVPGVEATLKKSFATVPEHLKSKKPGGPVPHL